MIIGNLREENIELDEPENIILIVTESMRADAFSCYGYQRNTTPNICEFAEDGVLFENAYAQASFTRVSVPALFTSLPPNSVYTEDWNHSIDYEGETFVEGLEKNNYTTYGNNVYGLKELTELFEYDDYVGNGSKYTDILIERERLIDEPSFGFIFFNYLSHDPFAPKKDYRNWDSIDISQDKLYEKITWENYDNHEYNFSSIDMRNLYDAEILQADDKINDLLEYLKDNNQYEDSLIIVTSDHGQGFKTEKERVSHGYEPYEEVINVPLIVKFPGNKWAGERVEEPVRQTDIAPTIYDTIGLEKDFEVGISLRKVIEGKVEDIYAFSSTFPDQTNNYEMNEVWSMRKDDYKYFLEDVNEVCLNDEEPIDERLYNLNEDPEELEDILELNTDIASELQKKICEIYLYGEKRKLKYEEQELSESTVSKLEELGYL